METKKSIEIVTGKNVPRIDGPLKVSGKAHYTSDFQFDRMVFAVPVGATIAKGKLTKLDTSTAEKMKGVVGVYTRANIGAIYRPTEEEGFAYKSSEPRPPFEDDTIRYYGQFIAVVVAETFEIAQAAARSVTAKYDAQKPSLSDDLQQEDMKKKDTARGDAGKAFQSAPVKIDHVYVTPTEVHNPIEMHATVAVWDFDGPTEKVTLYETSQAVGTHRNVMAQVLGLPKESVRVISHFLGSGFGGKLWPWPHSALAAATARKLRRPVKLVLDRQMMFMNSGHRPRTQQRIQLSADSSGRLVSLQHDYASQASPLEDYKENCGEVSGFMYKVPNVLVTSGVARRNHSVPTSMRGPGAVPGLFALESAMDELAVALKMDPVQLR
ncbi:MAG: xanthine dehydrogenase family protein molybdopterin-binding subunit, partial [Proteobacteria bacterium]